MSCSKHSAASSTIDSSSIQDSKYYVQGRKVDVLVHDLKYRCDRLVARMPERVFELYVPWITRYLERNAIDKSKTYLRIPVNDIAKAEHVEVPGLQRVLVWMVSSTDPHRYNKVSAEEDCTTVADRLRVFRACQILRLHDGLKDIKARIMQQIETEPLGRADVQVMWNAFGGSGKMFNEMIKNIARFGASGELTEGPSIQKYLSSLPESQRIMNRITTRKVKYTKCSGMARKKELEICIDGGNDFRPCQQQYNSLSGRVLVRMGKHLDSLRNKCK